VLDFNNKWLELHNFKIKKVMRRSYLALIVSALVLATTILWLLNTEKPMNIAGMVQFGIVFELVGFGVFVVVSRLKSERRREPVEDELSIKIMRKASSTAYYISIYMWLGFGFISDKVKLESHTLIGAGILGMALLFFASWIFYKTIGIKDV